MGHDALDDLRRIVVDDPLLRDRLLSSGDHERFIAELVAVAAGCGIDLPAGDVAEALLAARREHQELWV
jgi:hypothetical protein